jgi:hypothetical protein
MHPNNEGMDKRNVALRRGLRMAAQVAAVGALTLAGTGMARGTEPGDAKGVAAEPNAANAEGTANVSATEQAADLLRVRPEAKGCFEPVTWGPPAPPPCDVRGLDDAEVRT